MENEKIQKLIKFYLLATSLKDKIRSGWNKWNIDRQRVESVADLYIEYDRPVFTQKEVEYIADFIKHNNLLNGE